MRDGQRTPQECIKQPETRDGRAHGKRQRENRSGGSDFAFSELTETKNRVSAEGIEPSDETCVAAGFTMAQRGTEGAPHFAGITSLGERFVEMRLQLFVDLVGELLDAKQIHSPAPNRHVRPPRGRDSLQPPQLSSVIPPYPAVFYRRRSARKRGRAGRSPC